MFKHKSTETVTLTRTQLQAILEIITQIGGINRSESWNESKYNRNEKTVELRDDNYHNPNPGSSHWRPKEDQLPINGWVNDNDRSGRTSSLLMLNDRQPSHQLMSSSSSDSSKGEEMRADSVMTTASTNEPNFRRYARTNDSEFDLDALYRKRCKALEYSKALDIQHEEKMKRKSEEKQRGKEEEVSLEKRLEEQRNRMRDELERERKIAEEKRLLAEKKRQAVVAAMQKTPIIKKRNFLAETSADSQPVATIKPQSRSQDVSAQTDEPDIEANLMDAGTQTDIQLLLQFLNDMKIISKQRSKSLTKPEESQANGKTSDKTMTPSVRRKNNPKSDINLTKRPIRKSVWLKKPNGVLKDNSNESKTEKDDKTNYNKSKQESNSEKRDIGTEVDDQISSFRRRSLNISQSTDNLTTLKDQRIKSSIDVKSRAKFLPEISLSGRPHSRKKWYSQEKFDPNYLQE